MFLMRLISIIPFLFIFLTTNGYSAPSNSDTKPICNELILTLLTPNITNEINEHYKKTLKRPPVFAPYFGTKLSIERPYKGEQYTFLVTVHVIPYVGPHAAVGEDDITFKINVNGEVQTIKFIHQKDFELPPHLLDYYR